MSRITSYSVDMSIEATEQSSLKGTGKSPYTTQGHLQFASHGGWVPAPDFSPGERAFKPAETLAKLFRAFSPGVYALLNADRIASSHKNQDTTQSYRKYDGENVAL